MKYVVWFRDLMELHKKIDHKEILDLKGVEIDAWQSRAEEFIVAMSEIIKQLVK